MRYNHARVVLIALLLALASSALASNIWYVNGLAGNNNYNCMSATTACKTVGHAISLASSGDTIRVFPAIYSENLTIGKSLNVIGSGATTTIIDGRCVNTVITIPNTGAIVTLSSVTVRNGCARYGGGVSNRGTLRIIATTISGNMASIHNESGSAGGGGIDNNGALTINNSTLTGNIAQASSCVGCYAYGGGVANAISATLTINNSTLNGNVAHVGPCAISCAAFGGGILSGGTLKINNSSLSGNAADFGFGGGGINGPARIQNSIVARSPSGGNCHGPITSDGYNLSSDTTCNFNNTGDLNNTNPKLGTLGYYGGPTQTIPLLLGSPAIDAGNPNGCTDGLGHLLKTDQRGKPRPDTEDTGGCDIGATSVRAID